MASIQVAVTGGNGQLGQAIQKVVNKQKLSGNFTFLNSADLDITNAESVNQFFNSAGYTHIINCAAYTAVDKAEEEIEIATDINVHGPKNLAKASKANGITLIHISTDFVFDGYMNIPYKEEDIARPIGFYGNTKYRGEQLIQRNTSDYFIIRTSWLYSEFGHNFMKTMRKLGKERSQLSVVYDQVGSPTYAVDLAEFLLHIITSSSKDFGVYNYSNEGVASWYDFAQAIFELNESSIALSPILSEEYPTPAARPNYSVLDKTKTKETFSICIPHWRSSLVRAMNELRVKELKATLS